MITGMYRANTGKYVQVREVWGSPDLLTITWVESRAQDTVTRETFEYMLRTGMFSRCYRR